MIGKGEIAMARIKNITMTTFILLAPIIVAPLVQHSPWVALSAAAQEAADPSAEAASVARQSVEDLHEALLHVMQAAPNMDFGKRTAFLAPVIESSFNLPAMAQLAVGRHWAKMTPDQQSKMVTLFSQLSIGTYADRFKAYHGERFDILSVDNGPSADTFWVRTQITYPDPKDKPVVLNYLVRNFGADGVKIVDVYLDGAVSELATRRSEYLSVIRDRGIDGFLQSFTKLVSDIG